MKTLEQILQDEEITDFIWLTGSYLAEQQFPELENKEIMKEIDEFFQNISTPRIDFEGKIVPIICNTNITKLE